MVSDGVWLDRAPGTFQGLMNNVFHNLLDAGLLIYLDDILLYRRMLEEHEALLREVLG